MLGESLASIDRLPHTLPMPQPWFMSQPTVMILRYSSRASRPSRGSASSWASRASVAASHSPTVVEIPRM